MMREKKKSFRINLNFHLGHIDAVRVLVEMGADLEAKNDDGKTPLDVAIRGIL